MDRSRGEGGRMNFSEGSHRATEGRAFAPIFLPFQRAAPLALATRHLRGAFKVE